MTDTAVCDSLFSNGRLRLYLSASAHQCSYVPRATGSVSASRSGWAGLAHLLVELHVFCICDACASLPMPVLLGLLGEPLGAEKSQQTSLGCPFTRCCSLQQHSMRCINRLYSKGSSVMVPCTSLPFAGQTLADSAHNAVTDLSAAAVAASAAESTALSPQTSCSRRTGSELRPVTFIGVQPHPAPLMGAHISCGISGASGLPAQSG